MSERHKKSGFTLIEIMLVLAISSLLSLILLGFYSNTRQRAQFTDAVERTVAFLERIKTETTSSFTTGSGDNANPNSIPTRIFFGKLVTFPTQSSSNQSLVTAQSITIDKQSADDLGGVLSNIQSQGPITSFSIPWGVSAYTNNGNYQIVFSRQPANGVLNTYILSGDSNPYSADSYTSTEDTINEARFILTSPEGLQACIVVKASTGEITRTIDNINQCL